MYLRKVAATVIVFCLARYLTIETYGLYSSYANIAGLLLLITNFGFNEYILVSAKSDVKKVRLKLSFFLLLASVLLILILFFSLFAPIENKVVYSLVLIKVFLDNTFFSLILTYYQSSKKFKIISIINILYSIGLICTTLICYKYKLGLDVFLIGCITLGLINYLYSYIKARLSFFMVLKHIKKYFKMLDRELLYYGLVMVTVLLYFQMPSLFVSTFLDKTSAAIYFAAFNIFSIMMLVSSAQVQQIMPDIIKARDNEILRLLKSNIFYITIINFAILIFFILFGKWLLHIIYSKPEYLQSYSILLIGSVSNLFLSAGSILACFMTAKGFQKKKFYYQIEFIFVVVLLIFLLKDFGIKGAVLSYCLICAYVFFRYLVFTINYMRNYKMLKTKKCILCGNCAAICPHNAISFDNKNEKVIINYDLCKRCGVCLKICPAIDNTTSNSILGKLQGVYCGFSNNPEIRYKSASGGLLTETLKYLVENKIVDKVLITDYKEGMQAESYFTDNIDEIINAAGSKYQIINPNVALKEVLKEDLKYAYVGLPCHNMALEKFIKENPRIKDRILYKFSICCSHNTNIEILNYAAYYLKINKNEIVKIKYRGDGWPNYLTFTLKDGEKKSFPVRIWNDLFLSFFYTPKQCFNCTDFCGENSDISFADAWLQEYTSKKSDGYNLVFSHTEIGEKLLSKMSLSGAITLIEHNYSDIIKSQIIGLYYKKKLYSSHNILDILYKNILKFNSKISRHAFFKFVNPLLLRYYFCILNILFVRLNLKKYKEKLLK